MANSNLIGTIHYIPDEVMTHLKNTKEQFSGTNGVKGIKRLNELISSGYCTYEQLKRIKNYFSHLDPNNYDKTEFALNGGEVMKNWVDSKLISIRQAIYGKRKLNQDTAMLQQQDVTAPNVNPEVKNGRNVMNLPDIMSGSDLMEQVNKMKELIKTI